MYIYIFDTHSNRAQGAKRRSCFPHFPCVNSRFLFQEGDPYAHVCSGCRTKCEGCSFDEPLLIPKCAVALQHSKSDGGDVTLERLTISPGYWRATNTSHMILACFNADACRGGATGETGYCREGYEGPCKNHRCSYVAVRACQVLTSGRRIWRKGAACV